MLVSPFHQPVVIHSAYVSFPSPGCHLQCLLGCMMWGVKSTYQDCHRWKVYFSPPLFNHLLKNQFLWVLPFPEQFLYSHMLIRLKWLIQQGKVKGFVLFHFFFNYMIIKLVNVMNKDHICITVWNLKWLLAFLLGFACLMESFLFFTSYSTVFLNHVIV